MRYDQNFFKYTILSWRNTVRGYSIQQAQQSSTVFGGTKNWESVVEIVATTIIMVPKQQEKCFMNSLQNQQYNKGFNWVFCDIISFTIEILTMDN